MIIYKITNLINGKWYIGQDSRNLPSYLGGGILLKKAIKKYGRRNFNKEILEFLPLNSTKENLNKAEIFWIEKTNAVSDPMSYNISIGGSNACSNTETKNKIAKKLLNNSNGVGRRPHKSGINWDGKRGKDHHLYGKPSPKKGIKVTEKARINNALSKGAKNFYMIDKRTNMIKGEYLIITDCARENSLHHQAISSCLRGKRKSHGGYLFKYKEINVCP